MIRRNDWLTGQLPMGMLDDSFFVRFVALFQDVATTLLEGADNIPNTVDVTVAPLPVVRWLGSWIGISSIDSSLRGDLQRRFVRESSRALAWRGTRQGLARFLEVVTGAPAEITETGGILREGDSPNPAPFVRMRVVSTGWLSDEDFVELVADEVPANVVFELVVGDRVLWPRLPPPPAGDPPTLEGSALL